MTQHQQLLHKAQKAIAAGQPKRAEKTLRKLLKEKSIFLPVRLMLSKALVAQGQVGDAARFLGEAAAHQPENQSLQKAAGEMSAKIGDHASAINFLEKAVSKEPQNPELWHQLLQSMLLAYQQSTPKQQHALDDMVSLSTKATSLFPNHLGLINIAGEICFAAKLYEPAAQYLEACLDTNNPPNLKAHHRWLEIHHITQEYLPILRYAEKYHHLVGDDPLCNRVIAMAFEKDGEAHIAIKYIDKCLAAMPDDSEYVGSKGRLLFYLGRFEEALKWLDRSIELGSPLAAPFVNRCLVNKNLGNIAAAAKDEPYRLQIHDDNPKFHLDAPLWEGESLEGKRLFIWSDQGVGDVFKYAPLIHELDAKPSQIIICAQHKLVSFLRHVFPDVDVRPFPRYSTPPIPDGELRISPVFDEIEEDFDLHTPFGFLYRYFRPDIPAFVEHNKTYELAPTLVDGFRQMDILSNPETTKVGLAWSSKNKKPITERNYLDLQQLLPILRMPGFEFYNFQYDVSEEDINRFRAEHDVPIYHAPGLDLFDDLLGTAAFNKCMDIFFSPASTCSDIAGSLGIKSLRADLIHLPENLGQIYVPWYKDQKCISIPYGKTLMDFFPEIKDWLIQNRLHDNRAEK